MLALFIEYGAFLAKSFALISAVLFGIVGVSTLVAPQDFTHFILAGWIIIAAVCIVIVEGINEAAHHIFDRIPDLKRLKNRGILYAALGVLTFGRDWRPLGLAAGLSLIVTGALLVAIAIVNSQQEADTSARIAAANTSLNDSLSRSEKPISDLNANPTAFFRYEDDGTPHVANGNYAQV
eukprot:Blabericola_migrator_1__8819@NODE_465_length_8250_cov_107_590737_g363_i0_p5_GENE_NODE_465_length_8250_cov_107_590737_g363_i0NODE_465_length_8250_cov_107_590737_g363_i0_p5_ORF_typecomplete_len180_score28_99COPI_assoc/PF08507_10/2_1e12TMEM72/PF16054_5/0_2DUF4401/PF14351_6/0_22SieB/PF14163_6/2_4SieB/PF14163_6/1_6e02DUF3784/PF12650_7/5_4DUF3784/PF12650_7/61Amastin/PF07344_11/1_5Neurensin/PF14927_6/4_9e02Neurensin/PF14927_6/5_3e03Neurensin/PF14927_6/1_2MscL/PF01741_18/18MscL/PF01741_18/14MscL/PF01741